MKTNLLWFRNPRNVFVKCFTVKITSCRDTAPLGNIKCKNGHLFINMIKIVAQKIFNVGAKNYVNERNSEIHAARKNKRKSFTKEESKTQSARKIFKLQSDKI